MWRGTIEASKMWSNFSVLSINHFPKSHRKFLGLFISGTDLEIATFQLCYHIPPHLDQNCELTQWSAWGECSSSCGEGQQVSNRKVRCSDGIATEDTETMGNLELRLGKHLYQTTILERLF